MNIFELVLIALGIYLIIGGFYQAVKGKPLSKKEDASAKKYTPESYEKNNRVTGVILVVLGLLFILLRVQSFWFPEITIIKTIVFVGIGVGIVLVIVSNLLILKKVGTAGASSAENASVKQSSANDTEEYIDED